MLAAIVSYAKREGLLDHVSGYVNPFGQDVKLRVDRREEEGREGAFQPSDLAAIFAAGVFTSGERPAAGAAKRRYGFHSLPSYRGCGLTRSPGCGFTICARMRRRGGGSLT